MNLGSTYKHKKSGKIYVVVEILENKTLDTMGVVYHWIGAPKGFERNYFREQKDFEKKFKIVNEKKIKHSDLVFNVWIIAKEVVKKMKKCYNSPSENSTNVDWKQAESDWFDYIKELVGICDYQIKK